MSDKKNQKPKASRVGILLFSFILAVIAIFVGLAILYAGSRLASNSQQEINAPEPANPPGLPVRLLIPKIGVDANVQQVGITAGRLGIPSNFTDVAWYKMGPRPGAVGSAVIDGHLDNAKDARAVFMNLSDLKAGDDIYVKDAAGQTFHFRVIESDVYDYNSAPLAKIFSQNDGRAHLNLITCDGVWNEKTKNYSSRLVIYSERV